MAKSNNNVLAETLNKIVANTQIVGDIDSQTNIRVDGKIKGTLRVKGKLVLGEKGLIEGEINCESAEIEGAITGNITVSGLLSLKSTSRIIGDVITQKLSMETGAEHNGLTSMSSSVSKLQS
ncbi:MAG: cytoskeletal protein CcmA (bactofilin family) [Flavobacteriales bacterium]|jgi:cytoskeletal protein CcmA (bactofilin family)|tara:strand:+ start:30 stop:395 length:366 start_codon:yes stop_codon:yes gene_type:complete